MKSKILVVDDEPDALEVLGFKLREAGFEPIFAKDGARALAAARDERPDLMVLDLMLPEVDGLEVCKILRRDPATAGNPDPDADGAGRRNGPGARAGAGRRRLCHQALQPAGTGPADPQAAEPQAVRPTTTATHLRLGEIDIDVPRHVVQVSGADVALTVTEFKLLEILARRRGRVQSRDRLLQDVWGYENPIDSRTVDTHMRRLREKLGAAARRLETVRGVGYRFTAEN